MNQVYQSAFLKALGWSLIDSLWQMGLMWLVYMALTANGKRYQSHQRHNLALLSLTGGSLWFLVSLVMNFYKAAAAPLVVTVMAGAAAPAMDHGFIGNLSRNIESALPFLSIGYLLAAAWLFIRFYYRYHQTKQLLKAEMVKAGPELRVFLQQAAARMGIKKNVVLWLSAAAEAPMTLGFWKPVILLPISIVNHLSLQQTEAILLHELKHIKRNDYLINILIACVDVVLFFNPFARWMAAAIRREREHSCDDLVMQFRYDPAQYASSLLILEQQRSAQQQTLAVAATGSKTPMLLNRVKRILHQEQVPAPVSQRMIAYLVTAAMFGFIGLYNPGNMIVKTIYPAVFNAAAGNAQFVSYSLPAEEKPAPKVKKITVKIQAVCQASPEAPAQERVLSMLTAQDAEQILRMATSIQLASLVEKRLAEQQRMEAELDRMIINVSNPSGSEARDFTLVSQLPILCAPENSAEIKPWVPRNSFAYQYMEDSTAPKVYIASKLQEEAKLAINRALKALQDIDWAKLEQELREKGISMSATQIRQELHRAFMEITWKRISEGSVTPADNTREIYSRAQAEWQKKLECFQKERAEKRARQEALRKQIVEERLMENMKSEQQRKAIRNETIDI